MEFRRVLFRSIWPRAALRCSCKLAEERTRSAACRLKVIDPMPSTNFVFPVRYVSEGVAVQTTSRELSALGIRSEEHTSELQSRLHLVCRLLLEKKKKKT